MERTCISAQALRNFFCQILFTFATTHYAREKYFLLSHYALRRGSRHTYIFHYAKSFPIWSTICTRPFKVVRSYAILIFKYILLSQLRTTHHQNTFYFFYYALRRASRHTYICRTCMSAPVNKNRIKQIDPPLKFVPKVIKISSSKTHLINKTHPY